jgi:hypothetical protein
MYGCGLRISEAVSLEIGAIDSANMLLRIIGKGDKERLVTVLHGAGVGLRVDRWRHTSGSRFTSLWNRFAVPFKHHAEHRHHIPKPRYRVTNWAEYDASLRRRGSLTVWFADEAVAAWRAQPRTTPGGQPHYPALAISTAHHALVYYRRCRCRRQPESC